MIFDYRLHYVYANNLFEESCDTKLYFTRQLLDFVLLKKKTFVVVTIKKNISITKILFLTLKGTILSNPIKNYCRHQIWFRRFLCGSVRDVSARKPGFKNEED